MKLAVAPRLPSRLAEASQDTLILSYKPFLGIVKHNKKLNETNKCDYAEATSCIHSIGT